MIFTWSFSYPLCSLNSCCVYIRVCLWVTAPLSPLPCNSLGLGWQSRPDKWTQIASGDWRGVSALPSITPHPLLVSDRGSGCMMDGCPTLFLSTSHSVHSHLLTSLHLVSLHFPISCCLHLFFVICLYVLSPCYHCIIQSVSLSTSIFYFSSNVHI